MNIAHLLLGASQEFRDVTALARGETAYLSYRDFWRKVSVMSTSLRTRFGLERGDRVAFAMRCRAARSIGRSRFPTTDIFLAAACSRR